MLNTKKRSRRRETTMEEDEIVSIKVFDGGGDVVFDGKVSTDVTPDELLHLRCFRDRLLGEFVNKGTGNVSSFKGMQNVELSASRRYGKQYAFSGVLYRCGDGVLRKCDVVPSFECMMISVWGLSDVECEKLFKCETLEDLEINECELRQIPNDIGKMKMLKTLRLYELKELSSIPEEMGDISRLKELWIESCGIESLPKSIGRLKQLEEVKLWKLDNLVSIPEEIGCLSKLKKMEILNCRVESFPKSMRELKQLSYVHLQALVELQVDPEMILSFSRLKVLFVWGCDKFLQGNGGNAFCQMLKMSVSLRNVYCEWDKLKSEILNEALLENGSITKGEGYVVSDFSDIFERNRSNHARAMLSVLCMIAIRRCRRGLSGVPREIIDMLAKMLWITRCDVDAWMIEEEEEEEDEDEDEDEDEFME